MRALALLAKAFLAVCTLGVYPILLPGVPRLMNRMAVERHVKDQMYRDAVRREARRRAAGG